MVKNKSRYAKRLKNNRHIDELNYYNPYRLGDPYSDMMVKGLPFVFITTPLLNLNNQNIKQSEFFKYMSTNNKGLFKLLNYNGFGSGESAESQINTYSSKPFIHLLSNKFKSIDINDTSLSSKQYGETYYGYKMELPGPIIDSINGGQINITFQETKDLAIAKIFKVWTDYMEGVARGKFYTSNEARRQKIIDYTCSIYYFLLDFDGETIQYYCKYTGCMPLNVPYSALQQEVAGGHDPVELGISFNYSLKEDLDPSILTDFNLVSSNAKTLLSGGTMDVMYIPQDSAVMEGARNDIYENLYENADMTSFDTAAVVLENYGDNRDKYRYKLKFFESVNFDDAENDSTTGTGLGDLPNG